MKTIMVPQVILKWLTENFPDTLPKNTDLTLEELRFLQGQQSVIEALRLLNEENE